MPPPLGWSAWGWLRFQQKGCACGFLAGIGISILFAILVVVGVARRIEGHAKPTTGKLAVELIFMAIMLAYAVMSRRQAKPTSPVGDDADARLSPLASRAAEIVSGWLAIVCTVLVITGVIRRIEGQAKPHTGALIGEVVGAACFGCFATALRARDRGRSGNRPPRQVDSVALLAGPTLGLASSLALAVVLASDLSRRLDGHPKPSIAALVSGALLLSLVITLTVVTWRVWRTTRPPTQHSD